MDQIHGVRQLGLPTGVTLSYVSTGPASGTPVLLLHAWGESRRSFDRLLPLLPLTIHAMAMDQRGHGEASKPREGYSLEHFAQDIYAFMDAVGISSAVLMGSSSGGYVAHQVAITSPHRVAGLVLVASPRALPLRRQRSRPPTLVICGDRDELLNREHAEALAAAIPASRLVIYEETGHLVLWEQPERSASDLGTFIESLHSGLPDEP